MTADQIRKKYIRFFADRGHREIPAASLVPENDPTTLFTSSGMQPLVPYLMGQQHPLGTRLVNAQKCFRSVDIEEVGDNRHTTFFEMLGNWSLGDYFKAEQLPWLWEFLTEELALPRRNLWVAVFDGFADIVPDETSAKIWRKLGVSQKRIYYYDATKNWWSRSGPPETMPAGEIGGPSSEIFYEFSNVKHDSSFGKQCHPNCDCGRFMEIGNSVFIQYKKEPDGTLSELPQKNVDFGGGLERLAAAVNDDPDVFKTDSFLPIMRQIEKITQQSYSDDSNKITMRVVADHIKAATFLIIDGVLPSNKERGYVLRRLLRRASVKFALLRKNPKEQLPPGLTTTVLDRYEGIHNVKKSEQESMVYKIVEDEIRKFQKTLHAGLKILQKTTDIDGKVAFDLYQTYGFPIEITEELLKDKNVQIDHEEFQKEFKKHQELSRTASKGMFKGGLADHSEQTTKLHTAHHLLLAALQKVVDPSIKQRGSNITGERLRIDVRFSRTFTPEELHKAEALVNEKIAQNLPVVRVEMRREDAERIGAQMEFGARYPDMVHVYFIGFDETVDPTSATPTDYFSAEFCGGPHVARTGTIGGITIFKEQSAGSDIRRVYARLQPVAKLHTNVLR